MKIIKKLSPSRFQVTTEGVVGSDLTLDFAPLIKEHNLSGNYFLIHFQAKPKIHRQWGIYSGKDDSYTSVQDIVIFSQNSSTLNLDEARHNTVPTCVIYVETNFISSFKNTTYLGDNSKNQKTVELFPIEGS